MPSLPLELFLLVSDRGRKEQQLENQKQPQLLPSSEVHIERMLCVFGLLVVILDVPEALIDVGQAGKDASQAKLRELKKSWLENTRARMLFLYF